MAGKKRGDGSRNDGGAGRPPRDISLAEATNGLLTEIDADALARWEAANPTNPFLEEIAGVKKPSLFHDPFEKAGPEPFSDDWKTYVADAVAKKPKDRTEHEREAIKLAMKDANETARPSGRKPFGSVKDVSDGFERNKDGADGPSRKLTR